MDNIRFSCAKCGNCCKVGFVYLNKNDMIKLAGKLKLPLKEFKKKHTSMVLWLGRVMKYGKEGCVFLKGNVCSVYDARPEQCATYPYWKKLDINRAKEYCSGIKQQVPGGNFHGKAPNTQRQDRENPYPRQ
jgi:Fe-S-cluster containining protein